MTLIDFVHKPLFLIQIGSKVMTQNANQVVTTRRRSSHIFIVVSLIRYIEDSRIWYDANVLIETVLVPWCNLRYLQPLCTREKNDVRPSRMTPYVQKKILQKHHIEDLIILINFFCLLVWIYSVDRQWRLELIHTLLLSRSIPLDLSRSIPFWVDPHPFEKKGVDRLKMSLTVHTVRMKLKL